MNPNEYAMHHPLLVAIPAAVIICYLFIIPPNRKRIYLKGLLEYAEYVLGAMLLTFVWMFFSVEPIDWIGSLVWAVPSILFVLVCALLIRRRFASVTVGYNKRND
jgi:hypothetical protein